MVHQTNRSRRKENVALIQMRSNINRMEGYSTVLVYFMDAPSPSRELQSGPGLKKFLTGTGSKKSHLAVP